MEQRLFQFLILDGRARWRAFMTAVGVSIAIGTTLFVAGVSEGDALIVVSVISVIVFSSLALRYASRRTLRKPHETPLRQDRAKLLWMELALVGAADWVLATVLGAPASAIAFANTTRQALKDNKEVSAVSLDFSKALITSHLPRAPETLRTQLLSARAVLSSAQVYSSVKSSIGSREPYISHHPTPESIREHLDRPVRFLGASRSDSILMFAGNSQPKILVKRDLIIDTMTMEATALRPPERLPVLLHLEGGVHVFLKNCTIRYVTQNLSRIVCFDVLFENCSIDLRSSGIVLVDVSFRNCDISCTEATKREFPQLSSGNATNITTEVG